MNGNPTFEFSSYKGLRQGDPLTSFIFLIVAEGLAWVVKQAEEKSLLGNIEIGDRKIKVSMLQHADDTLFFSNMNMQSMLAVKATLICFRLAFVLKVN